MVCDLRQAAMWAHVLAPRDRDYLVGGEVHDREVVEPEVDRPQERQESGRAVARRGADLVQGCRLAERERP